MNYNVGLDTETLYLPFGIEIGGLFNVKGNLKNNIANGVFKTDRFFANMDSQDKLSIVLKGFTSNIDYHFDFDSYRKQGYSNCGKIYSSCRAGS